MHARVLVVDDEAIARALFTDALLEAGHRVRAVASGDEALSAFRAEKFDIVVTDLILPGLDGLQLLTEIKKLRPETEVIVVTGLEKVEPAVRALKSGACEYLVKPLAPEALQGAVSRALLTRQLLKENNALRAHVALLEAGQQIATTLERTELAPLALDALERELRPEASVLLVESGGRLQATSSRNLDDGEARALAFALEAHRVDAIADRPVTLPLPNGRHALAFLARQADRWLGALIAVSPTRVDPAALSAGTFLASHVGLALQTAGRMAAVEDLAYQDDLTGLFNTRYLDLVLGRELRRATASGEPLSLLFMDLDRFKQVNDRHGHLAGSKVLQEFGKLLQRCVRDCDVVVRYGGDEFVVVLLGTPAAGALRIAERIRTAVEGHAFFAPEGVSLTVCIGVASSPEHGVEGRALLALADSALFRGKRDQRNAVHLADLGDASKAG